MGAVRKIVFLFCCVLFAICAQAQTDSTHRPLKIAVFAPVYLDSAFTQEGYKLGKNIIPRYMLAGLDFYHGMMMSVDSLNKENTSLQVLFYDTKSATNSIDQVIASEEMTDVSLIIASFNTKTEVKPLADLALAKQIPLISATYPNDADVTANPYFVLLNPTLLAHVEALYKYIHKTFATDNIVMFRRKGDVGNLVQSIFMDRNKNTGGVPLKIKIVELADDFTQNDLLSNLDSNRQRNIVFCASINEAFGANLSKTLGSNKSYHAIAIGMPTWDGLKDISKDLDIIYSTPYNFTKIDKLSTRVSDLYKLKYAARPGDMVFKGFETMYRFSKLLLKYGGTIMDHLSEKEYKLFNDLDIQPVTTGTQTEYLENKKFYFIRKKDGLVKSVN